MSSLDDLKETLGAHAPALDHDLAARPGAVARRVTAVRRRRAAVAATFAAAVIAGGSWYAVADPQRAEPPVTAGTEDRAPDRLLGHEVPRTIELDGLTYEYVSGKEGEAGATRVSTFAPATDGPLLVTWVTEQPGEAQVTAAGGGGPAETAGPFEGRALFTEPLTTKDVVQVVAQSRPAVAIYVPSTPAELKIFPLEAGGYHLRAPTLADPGERTFSRGTVLPFDVQFAIHCTAADQVEDGPRMPWVTIDVLGWQVLQVSCGAGGAPADDPAAFLYGPKTEDDGATLVGRRTDADGTVRERRFAADRNITFTVRLTDKDGRDWTKPVDGLRMGVGIYGR